MAQRCYNMEAVPPYNPYAPSTEQPPQRVKQASAPLDGTQTLNTEETSTHTFLQVPYDIQDVASGVAFNRWNQMKKQHTEITSI